MGKFWVEKWIGNKCLYFGFFSKKDYRLGLSIGNREGSINLIICTMGYSN
jgi:hypothetical protein